MKSAPVENREKSRGQSLVEFGLMLPILLVLLMVAVDFGRAYMAWVTTHNMARIGANFAALNPGAWQAPDNGDKVAARNRYAALMAADATQINCDLPSPLLDPVFTGSSFASSVRVEVTCDFQLITPLLGDIMGSGGRIPITATTNFTVRTGFVNGQVIGGGGVLGSPEPSLTAPPTPSPTPTPAPTAPPAPTPTPDPNASPDPNATPTPPPTPGPTPQPTLPPVNISFYGVPTNLQDVYGGGPPGSENENQIVGLPTLNVTFYNTTTGVMGQCHWDFGDGTTSNSCGNTVNKAYTARGTYHVRLTVNGQGPETRVGYVLVGCKVPSLIGVRRNTSSSVWTANGFTASNFSSTGNGNYIVRYQSLTGGMVNPPGGCSGAQITVGP